MAGPSAPITRREFWNPRPALQQEFDILFVDTEFSRLPLRGEAVWEWAKHVELLSIGISALEAVDPPGFYAVRELTPQVLERCTAFVEADVLPYLQAVEPMMQFVDSPVLRVALERFLAERHQVTGKPPAFAVDWAGEAWLLDAVMSADSRWVLLEDLPGLTEAVDGFFNEDFVRHNAYNDAVALRHGYLELLNP